MVAEAQRIEAICGAGMSPVKEYLAKAGGRPMIAMLFADGRHLFSLRTEHPLFRCEAREGYSSPSLYRERRPILSWELFSTLQKKNCKKQQNGTHS